MFNPNVTRYPLTRYCEVLNNMDLFAVVLLVVGPRNLHGRHGLYHGALSLLLFLLF